MARMADIDIMLQDLEEHLKNHDWYYTYSDDHRYWTAGCESADRLTKEMNELKSLGFGAEAQALWDTHCPWAKEEDATG